MSEENFTTLEFEEAALPVLASPDERHYRKIRKLLPSDSESIARFSDFKASFYPWPQEPHETYDNWICMEEYSRAWVSQKGFRPPQQSICVAATFVSKFLANSTGMNKTGRWFAINGAVALWALGATTRSTWSIDILFRCYSFRPLIADLVECPRFILPDKLQAHDKKCAYDLHLFVRVGPSMGDTELSQDNIIFTRMTNVMMGLYDPEHCAQVAINVHDTVLVARSLDVFGLLKSKLDQYERYSKRRDWEEARDLVYMLPEGSDILSLGSSRVNVFLHEPPAGLTVPVEWYEMWTNALRNSTGFLHGFL